ncbi:hypothetical protein QBC47DRAFT_36294 [Echria macrotheca]|uniref:Protein kinase domain-containing protein n=1 Tax=Echria macrotheca TaxID=438768 RepID=A0AAJ0FAD1_9PEZI|nr:hypothetical protein QBC47DRAFT_36294 [Echria macrotheca]
MTLCTDISSPKIYSAGLSVEICDFGLCDNASRIQGRAGTIPYMAPEVMRMEKSTPKSDVYSLFMTMFWVRDTNGFRKLELLLEDYDHILDVVFASSSSDDWIKGLRPMGEINPDHRASAAQMLVTRFNGEGLSTPINRIPPILDQVTLVTPQSVTGLAEAPFTPPAPQIAVPPRPRSRRRGRSRRQQLAPVRLSRSPLPAIQRGTLSRWEHEENANLQGTMAAKPS